MINVILLGGGPQSLFADAKKDFYTNGPHLAQCSKNQAIFLVTFVVMAIFFTSLAAAFVRPFNRK